MPYFESSARSSDSESIDSGSEGVTANYHYLEARFDKETVAEITRFFEDNEEDDDVFTDILTQIDEEEGELDEEEEEEEEEEDEELSIVDYKVCSDMQLSAKLASIVKEAPKLESYLLPEERKLMEKYGSNDVDAEDLQRRSQSRCSYQTLIKSTVISAFILVLLLLTSFIF